MTPSTSSIVDEKNVFLIIIIKYIVAKTRSSNVGMMVLVWRILINQGRTASYETDSMGFEQYKWSLYSDGIYKRRQPLASHLPRGILLRY